MSQTYQTIGLFFAIFTLAYGGSLFKQLKDRQDSNAYQHNNQVVAQIAAKVVAPFINVIQMSPVATTSENNDTSLNKPDVSAQDITLNRKTVQNKQTEYALKRPANQSIKSAKHTFPYGSNKPVTEQNSPVHSLPDIVAVNTMSNDTYLVSNTALTRNTGTTLTSDITLVETGFNTNAIQTLTTSNRISDDTTVEDVSENTSNTESTLSKSTNTKDTSSESEANLIEDKFVESEWATLNCPHALPEGSTEITAKQYQQANGCRYLESCRALNDGSKGYQCLWQFYSSN